MDAIKKRFESKYEAVTESGCWLWNSTIRHTGYGGFWMDGGSVGAHRASWIIHCGAIPTGLHVCHKCDTPLCVNPRHLFLGSPADNVADKSAKGRAVKGADHPLAKLDDEMARDIYLARGSQAEIATRYGVHQSQVSNIKRRVTWVHATRLIA